MQILLDDHVLDRLHGRHEEVRIGGIRVVDVNFAIGYSVDTAEPISEIPRRRVDICRRPGEVWKVVCDWRDGEFPLEEIDLVEEEDDGFAFEPFSVDQRLEEHHRLVHLILIVRVARGR